MKILKIINNSDKLFSAKFYVYTVYKLFNPCEYNDFSRLPDTYLSVFTQGLEKCSKCLYLSMFTQGAEKCNKNILTHSESE